MKPTYMKSENRIDMTFEQRILNDFLNDGGLAVDLHKVVKNQVDKILPSLFTDVKNAQRKGQLSDGHLCLRVVLSLGNVEAFKDDEDED